MTEFTMGLRFEIDALSKISVLRVEGLLTDELLGVLYEANRKHCNVNKVHVGIVDLSSIREFALSNYYIQSLASHTSAVEDADRLCVIIAPEDYAYGLSRMFQIAGEEKRPSLQVMRTMSEALAAMSIRPTYFKPSLMGTTQNPGSASVAL